MMMLPQPEEPKRPKDMSLVTFKKAVDIRKLIRKEAPRLKHDGRREAKIELTDEEIIQISQACQDAIIPGINISDVRPRIQDATIKGIERIRTQRLASNIFPHKESPFPTPVGHEEPTP